MLIETCKRMTRVSIQFEFLKNSRRMDSGRNRFTLSSSFEATPFRARSICRARDEEKNGVKNTRQPEGTSEAAYPHRVRDIRSVRYSAPVFAILEKEREEKLL